MITEDAIRAALHDAAARVEVDEELAWQRAWIGVARQPIRRVRRTSFVLAAAAAIVVAIWASNVLTRDDTSTSVRSVTRPAASAPGAVPTLFDRLAAGDTVAPQSWIAAADALAARRGNVAGSLVRRRYTRTAPEVSTTIASLSFATDIGGQYRIDDPPLSSYAVADGSIVQIDTTRAKVDVEIAPTGSGSAPMLNVQIGQMLRPGAWVQETLTNNRDLGIVFLGRDVQHGHVVLRFGVTFGSRVVFSDLGWELALDARTGVVLSAVQHYASTPYERETFTVEGFDDHAGPVRSEAVVVPGGYSIAAAIAGTPVRGLVVPAAGETVAALLAQVRAAAP